MSSPESLKNKFSEFKEEVSKLVDVELSNLKEDTAKLPSGGDLAREWGEAFNKLEQKIAEQREALYGLPAPVAKEVDNVFEDLYPEEAIQEAKQFLSGNSVSTGLDTLKKEIKSLTTEDVMSGEGVTRLKNTVDNIAKGAGTSVDNAGNKSLSSLQRSLSHTLTTNPEVAFSSLTSMKFKGLETLQKVNSTAANISSAFTRGNDVLDSLGLPEVFPNPDMTEVEGTVSDVAELLRELEKVILFTQSELANRGSVDSANKSRADYLSNAIQQKLRDDAKPVRHVGRLNKLKSLAKFEGVLKDGLNEFNELCGDVDEFIPEIEALDIKIPGSPVLKSKVSSYGDFRRKLLGHIEKADAALSELGKTSDVTYMSDRVKQLSGGVATPSGIESKNTILSDTTDQKNNITVISNIKKQVLDPILNTMVGMGLIADNTNLNNPASMVDVSDPNYRAEEVACHSQISDILTNSTLPTKGQDLQNGLSDFSKKLTAFKNGHGSKTEVITAMGQVISDANDVVAESSNNAGELENVVTPTSSSIVKFKKCANSTLGSNMFSTLLDRGKYAAALNLDWEDAFLYSKISQKVEQIKGELEALDGDVKLVEETLTTLAQRTKVAENSGINIVSEFTHATIKVKNLANYRVTRMKRLKETVDQSKLIIESTIEKYKGGR